MANELPETSNSQKNTPSAPPKSRSNKTRHPWVWAVVLIVTLGIGGVCFLRHPGKSARSKAASPPPAMIGTAAVQKGDIGAYGSALGVVTPVNTVAVKSRVDGQLVKVYYRE